MRNTIITIGLIVVVVVAFGGCSPKPIIVRVPADAWKQLAEQMKIVSSPRYGTASYCSQFTLTVLSGLAHPIRVNISAKEYVDISPGSQVDIPFKKHRVGRVLPLTVVVFDNNKKVIATLAGEVHVPSNKRRFWEVSGSVWHITGAHPLSRIE